MGQYKFDGSCESCDRAVMSRSQQVRPVRARLLRHLGVT